MVKTGRYVTFSFSFLCSFDDDVIETPGWNGNGLAESLFKMTTYGHE